MYHKSNSSSLRISETVYKCNQTLDEILFPEKNPYNQGCFQISELHNLFYAEYGNPRDTPVLFIHGGPGAGCDNHDARYFDPKHYRIILFDQRGSGASSPFGEMRDNTPQDSIEDIEKLRNLLKIEKWFIFGGSWGSALSIAYGETYLEKCLGFILRGIFLGRQSEINNVWYGMQDIFPETWEEFKNFLPKEEQTNLIAGTINNLWIHILKYIWLQLNRL